MFSEYYLTHIYTKKFISIPFMKPLFKAAVTTNVKLSNQVYPTHAETYIVSSKLLHLISKLQPSSKNPYSTNYQRSANRKQTILKFPRYVN